MGQASEQPSIEERFLKAMDPVDEKPEVEEKPEEEAPKEEAPKEATQEEEKPSIEVDPAVPFLEITTKGPNGEDITKEWSLDEMRSGVMMQADYQRKTAELARAREEVSKEVTQKVTEAEQKYGQNVRVLYNAVAHLAGQELQQVDWTKLAREDPAQFVVQSQKAQQFNQVIAAAQQELLKLEQQDKQKFEQAIQRQTQDAVEVLQRDIKGWGNDLYASILKTGVDAYGFKPDEVGNVIDPRMIKVLHDAHQYRLLQQAKPQVTKRVAAAPKVMKPGAAPEASDKSSRYQEARKKLSKSHGIDDAARAFFERDQLGR